MCQPMMGLLTHEDDPDGRYHCILTYSRALTPQEIADYELDDLTAYKPPSCKFQEQRQRLGLSLKDISDMTGISPRTMERYERNDGFLKCTVENAVKIAKAMNTTVEDLI